MKKFLIPQQTEEALNEIRKGFYTSLNITRYACGSLYVSGLCCKSRSVYVAAGSYLCQGDDGNWFVSAN